MIPPTVDQVINHQVLVFVNPTVATDIPAIVHFLRDGKIIASFWPTDRIPGRITVSVPQKAVPIGTYDIGLELNDEPLIPGCEKTGAVTIVESTH